MTHETKADRNAVLQYLKDGQSQGVRIDEVTFANKAVLANKHAHPFVTDCDDGDLVWFFRSPMNPREEWVGALWTNRGDGPIRAGLGSNGKFLPGDQAMIKGEPVIVAGAVVLRVQVEAGFKFVDLRNGTAV